MTGAHICGYKRGDESICQESTAFSIHYVIEGVRHRTRACPKHVGKRIQRAVVCAGAERATVKAWQPLANGGLSE